MRLPHTAWRKVSSAISFRLPPASISADASSGSPLSSACALDLLWAVHSTACAVSFPLSDLRCFGILSSASVLDSDYSASVLPFLTFPVPPHSCFPGARLGSRLPRFPPSLQPDFSCLPSRFLYSALLFVSFHSSLLRSHSRSTGAYLPFRFLSSASLSVFSASAPLSFVRLASASSYSAFCSSFPFLPGSALQLLSRCPVSALASSVSSFSPAWFPVPSFRIPVLGFADGFLSPFPDSLPQLFLRCLPRAFAFGLSPSASLSFVRSVSGSCYSASVSSFPLSSRFCLTVACSVRPSAFASLAFPVPSDLVSRVLSPGSSYLAFCSFPFAPP